MRRTTSRWPLPLLRAAAVTLTLGAAREAFAQVTVTNSRPDFAAALGVPLTVETFTSGFAFPLGTSLNSATSIVPPMGHAINAGDIQPGVTYTVAQGALLIDEASSTIFTGGFLDGCRPAAGCIPTIPGTVDPMVALFDHAVRGFGFDASDAFGAFDLVVNFAGGTFSQSFSPVGTQFFGFYRPTADIASVSIISSNPLAQKTFALDNFTFPTVAVSAVPEPSTVLLLAGGLVGVLGVARRRRTA
jgi:hypothetical protein